VTRNPLSIIKNTLKLLSLVTNISSYSFLYLPLFLEVNSLNSLGSYTDVLSSSSSSPESSSLIPNRYLFT
jgi:hypothetical protein